MDRSRPRDDCDGEGAAYAETHRRLRSLLTPSVLPAEEHVDLGPCGAGEVRSLEEYEAFAGVDSAGPSISSYAMVYPIVYTEDGVTVQSHGALAGSEGVFASIEREVRGTR